MQTELERRQESTFYQILLCIFRGGGELFKPWLSYQPMVGQEKKYLTMTKYWFKWDLGDRREKLTKNLLL